MPNIALVPNQNPRIADLEGVISGYYDMQAKLRTHVGTEPLEDGSSINDHAVANSIGLTLTGIVSEQNRTAAAAYERIEALYNHPNPITVITPWHTFEEMIIEQVDITQRGEGFQFVLKLLRVIRVGVTAVGDNVSGPAQGRGAAVNRGRVISPPES